MSTFTLPTGQQPPPPSLLLLALHPALCSSKAQRLRKASSQTNPEGLLPKVPQASRGLATQRTHQALQALQPWLSPQPQPQESVNLEIGQRGTKHGLCSEEKQRQMGGVRTDVGWRDGSAIGPPAAVPECPHPWGMSPAALLQIWGLLGLTGSSISTHRYAYT